MAAVSSPAWRGKFRTQFEKTRLCRYFPEGLCGFGDRCMFAHAVEEISHAPDLRKTSLCRAWKAGTCNLHPDKCPFAHGKRELRVTPAFMHSGLSTRTRWNDRKIRGSTAAESGLDDANYAEDGNDDDESTMRTPKACTIFRADGRGEIPSSRMGGMSNQSTHPESRYTRSDHKGIDDKLGLRDVDQPGVDGLQHTKSRVILSLSACSALYADLCDAAAAARTSKAAAETACPSLASELETQLKISKINGDACDVATTTPHADQDGRLSMTTLSSTPSLRSDQADSWSQIMSPLSTHARQHTDGDWKSNIDGLSLDDDCPMPMDLMRLIAWQHHLPLRVVVDDDTVKLQCVGLP